MSQIRNAISSAWHGMTASGFHESSVKHRLRWHPAVLEKLGAPNAIGRYSADQIIAAGGEGALGTLRLNKYAGRVAVLAGAGLVLSGVAAALGVAGAAYGVLTSLVAGWAGGMLYAVEPGGLRVGTPAQVTGALRIRQGDGT